MDSIDLGLFDFDRHNALYYFILNADEQIYMRYGGRDAESATSYLNLRSLELALEEGLKMHAAGDIPQPLRPPPLFARDMPLLSKRTLRQGACVECHLIADFQNIQRELDGELDRLRDVYRSPDIKTIGINLKVPAGLMVDTASGPVGEAGLRSGDTITHVNGMRVRTFGDLQYHYDKVPRDTRHLSLGIVRDEIPFIFDVELPERWWLTDLEFRHWTVDPVVFFKTKPLSRQQKEALHFSIDGFAGEVTERERFHDFASPPIKVGDIVYGVDEVFEDAIADTPELHIQLRHRAGSKLKLHVLRGQERFLSELTTQRQNFRKYSP